MHRVARRARALWLLMLLLLGGLGYFCRAYGLDGASWALHSANPHAFGANGTLKLGSVVDRDGSFLLWLQNGRVYAADAVVRSATLHWLGDRSGNIRGTALQTYAGKMAGYSPVHGLYGYGGGGAQAQLTLSSYVQAAALEALGDYKGTVAVCNYQTGALICAVTSPTFDPDGHADLSDPKYEGVYLNRFTQAAYVPGSIFKIVTTAAALENMPGVEELTYTCTGTHKIDGDKVTCERAHGKQDLQAAMKNSCNCYYANLSMQLGAKRLAAYVRTCGVLDSVEFDGIATTPGNFQISGAADVQIAWSAIGQHKDLINPCAFLTFVSAVANGGRGPMPYVVASIRKGKQTLYEAVPVMGDAVMSTQTASMLQTFMRNNVVNNYGQEHFPYGMTVCAKSGTGEVDGNRKPYAMFTGFVEEEAYPLAFIVAVEDAGYGKKVCIPILSKVLAACQAVLDRQA